MEPPLIVLAPGPGYEGMLAIDSLYNDRSSGGLRIAPDLALEEIRELAREMTLKFALFRLPRGGAKAGLRLAGDLDAEARREALEGFGRRIGPIIRAGLYYPGTDMNCGFEDLRAVYAGAGLSIGRPTDTAFFTALGVSQAIQGCVQALELPHPVTLAIEGFGQVAAHMAAMLPAEEFRITALSTIRGAIANPSGFAPDELRGAKADHGDDLVRHLPGTDLPLESLLGTPADILVPAARTGSITADAARAVRARAIVPAANAPYAPGAAALLHDRGVLCLPGCLCNAGGVFGSSLADSGIPPGPIERLFQTRYRALVRHLVAACLPGRLSPVAVVEAVAEREARARGGRAPAGAPPAGLPRRIARKLTRRAARCLPRAYRRSAVWRQAHRALDALEADFREV
ncbi:MAG: Glu/Leu/Phe/Val dehydrogenase [Candidatus Eisenbacteria bacterium]|uniref:Glu/Leu/Phe/Val dehydrogenase n=1 Tax=Eiseniibacteriota bacterium TaxID=2212470 RepID=A0A937XFN0_UNCEI|nr:Glu/Leu/Phe/Val dehydrogenase [Candidatus Eisenbacteria bacterium]